MQIRSYIWSILIFIFSSAGAQQITNLGAVLSTKSNTEKYKLQGEQFYSIIVPSGSEFFNDSWSNGYVVLENGDRYDSLFFRFNTYRNELILLHPRNSAMITLDKEVVSEFGINVPGDRSYLFKKLSYDKIPHGDYYFNVLYDGEIKLAVWHRTTEDQTSPYIDKYGIMRSSIFVLRSYYYLVFEGNRFERMKLKRNAFLKSFGEKKPEVRKFLRTKHARYLTEKDFINNIRWIDTEFH